MSDDPGTFSVDIEELERGGVRIKDLATTASSIYGDLFRLTDKYGHTLGGNGDIGKSFEVNYYPSADASLDFLRDLKDLVDAHGSKTLSLGGLFGGVNATATDEASTPTVHRH